MSEADLQATLRDLFASQRLAVLSTASGDQPYSSLVAFVATDDLRHLLFVTARDSRKYSNLLANRRVALLVDNRSNRETDFAEAIAVTATGTAAEAGGDERGRLAAVFVARHPALQAFVALPSVALVKVTVDSYYLVSEFQKLREWRVAGS